MEVVLLVHICENSWVVGSLTASFYYGCLAIYLNEIWNETASLTKIHICQDTHYLLRFHESNSIYLQILKWIFLIYNSFNPLSANPTKWSQHIQTICQQQPMNCLSVFDHFVGLALKVLINSLNINRYYWLWNGRLFACSKYLLLFQWHWIILEKLKTLKTLDKTWNKPLKLWNYLCHLTLSNNIAIAITYLNAVNWYLSP